MLEYVDLDKVVDIGKLFDDYALEKKMKKELKTKVISDGTVELVRMMNSTQHSFEAFYIDFEGSREEAKQQFKKGYKQLDIEAVEELRSLFVSQNEEAYNMALNVIRAFNKRVKRTKEFISCLLKKPCVFLTLTFRDDVFDNTSELTRRRYVTRYLKSFDVPYVANIDFGDKNGREHYHCVLQVDSVKPGQWKYGILNFQKCKTSDKDKIKMAKYINKLSYHSLKESNKNQKVIYSSKKPNCYNHYYEKENE